MALLSRSIFSLGLCLAGVTFAGAQVITPQPRLLDLEPAPPASEASAPVDNQKAADAIAANLRQSPRIRGYDIDISYQAGLVELTGTVSDRSQLEEIERIVGTTGSVTRIVNRLHVRRAARAVVTQAQVLQPPSIGGAGNKGATPAPSGPQEPTPIFRAPMPGANPNAYYPPRMPPYAWPTYAPYNNYSRVAYPKAYPYKSWPFIGPFYPFPKIPLGWRSVSLTWQDGFWWYGRNASGHDWWRVRFW